MNSCEHVSPLRGEKCISLDKEDAFVPKRNPLRLVSYVKTLLPLLSEKTQGALKLDVDIFFKEVFLLGIVNYRNYKLQGITEPELCSKKLCIYLALLRSVQYARDFWPKSCLTGGGAGSNSQELLADNQE